MGKAIVMELLFFRKKYNGVTADFTNCELRAVDGFRSFDKCYPSYGYGYTFVWKYDHIYRLYVVFFGKERIISPDGSNGYLHAGVIRLGLGWNG